MERQRVAKDLHDGVGQTILAAKLNFVAFQKDMVKHKERFAAGLQFIDRASRELREIYNDLYPSILSDMGLESTIRWYAKNSLEMNKVKVSFDISIEEKIPHTLEVDIYRITKELFSNIAKHSGADSVNFMLHSSSDMINLEVADNGSGFEVSSNNERRGFGISNIKQRVNSHGGEFLLRSAPGEGVSVKIAIKGDGQ
jgi:two-component system NarL family sensor kinase